jgi:hypothetical protein
MIFTRFELINSYNTKVYVDEVYVGKKKFMDGIKRTDIIKEAKFFAENEPGVMYISGRSSLGKWFTLERDNNQYMPDWFDGYVGKESETVVNRHSGKDIKLNPLEYALYDFIIRSEARGLVPIRIYQKVALAKAWFYENNAKAYLTLID